jgi:hypothetical protein
LVTQFFSNHGERLLDILKRFCVIESSPAPVGKTAQILRAALILVAVTATTTTTAWPLLRCGI